MNRQDNLDLAKKVAPSDDDLLRICQRFSPGQDLDLAKAVRDEVTSRLAASVPPSVLAAVGDADQGAGALPSWLDLAVLRRRAERATGGEWKSFVNEQGNTFEVQLAPRATIIHWMGFDGVDMSRKQKAANARYIAAAAPRTVLALLDALAALQSSKTAGTCAEGVGSTGNDDRATLGIPDCGGPLCGKVHHHPLCGQFAQEETATASLDGERAMQPEDQSFQGDPGDSPGQEK